MANAQGVLEKLLIGKSEKFYQFRNILKMIQCQSHISGPFHRLTGEGIGKVHAVQIFFRYFVAGQPL